MTEQILSHFFNAKPPSWGPEPWALEIWKSWDPGFWNTEFQGGWMEINQQISGPSFKNWKKKHWPRKSDGICGLNETSVEPIIVSKDVMFFLFSDVY